MAVIESLVPVWRSGAQLPHSMNVLRPDFSMPDDRNKASIPYPSMHKPAPIPTGEANSWPRFVYTAISTSYPPWLDSYQYGSKSHSAALRKHPSARSCLYKSQQSIQEITYHCGEQARVQPVLDYAIPHVCSELLWVVCSVVSVPKIASSDACKTWNHKTDSFCTEFYHFWK